MRRWYNFNTGGATPTPVVTQHSTTGLAPGETGTHRIELGGNTGNVVGAQIDLRGGRNIIRRRIANDGSGNEYALGDPGLDPNTRYGSAQYIPTKSKYDDWGQLYGDVDQGVQGYEQAQTNLGNIQGLQDWQANYQPQDLSGYARLSDIPDPQDISGIGVNQQAIQGLQDWQANYQAPDLSGYARTSDLPQQQDISGIGANAAAIQALQNAPQQDISGIGSNAAAIQALQNAPQQDISGIGSNAQQIQALQDWQANYQAPQQQDISGIGGNAAAIQALQQQLAAFQQAGATPTAPSTPSGPSVTSGPLAPTTPVGPGTATSVPITSAAQDAWNVYQAGTNPYEITGGRGVRGGPSQYAFTPRAAAPLASNSDDSQSSGSTATASQAEQPAPVAPQAPTGGPLSVDPATLERQAVQLDEHGFTSEEVRDARARLDAGETVGGFSGPGQFTAGADQATQHADNAAVADAYGDVLSAVPNDGSATKDQRVGAAAANPAYNPGLADDSSNTAVNVGGGGTKRAIDLQSKDFSGLSNQQQSRAAGASVNAAGIRNIGGATARDGDNHGLPGDFLVSKIGDRTEVFGPDGTVYNSVAEAKAAAGEIPGEGTILSDVPQIQAPPAVEATPQKGTFFNPVEGSGTLSAEEHAQHKADRERGGIHYQSSSDQRRDNENAANARRAESEMVARANATGGNQIRSINGPEKSLNHEEVRDGLSAGWKPVLLDGGYYLVNGGGSASPVNPRNLETYGVDLSTVVDAQTPPTPRLEKDPGPPPQAIPSQAETRASNLERTKAANAQRLAEVKARNAQRETGIPDKPAAPKISAQEAHNARVQAAQDAHAARVTSAQEAEAAYRGQTPTEEPAEGEEKKLTPAEIQRAKHKAIMDAHFARIANFNNGGPIMGYNSGGYISPEEEELARKRRIASSRVPQAPLAQAAKGGQAPPPPRQSYSGESAAAQLAKKALLSQLGPIGGLLGGLFNDGGMVEGYNKGGSVWDKIWGSKSGKKGSLWEQFGRNDGGPVPTAGPLGNPNGYNEGGPGVGATPIKRVQDEQKIELDKMTWDKMEARKDQQMQMDEKRKQEAFQMEQQRKAEAHTEAMKMKKAAATTNKGPLGG